MANCTPLTSEEDLVVQLFDATRNVLDMPSIAINEHIFTSAIICSDHALEKLIVNLLLRLVVFRLKRNCKQFEK